MKSSRVRQKKKTQHPWPWFRNALKFISIHGGDRRMHLTFRKYLSPHWRDLGFESRLNVIWNQSQIYESALSRPAETYELHIKNLGKKVKKQINIIHLGVIHQNTGFQLYIVFYLLQLRANSHQKIYCLPNLFHSGWLRYEKMQINKQNNK